jgi:hypothetical protein
VWSYNLRSLRTTEKIMKVNQRRFIMLGIYLVLEQVCLLIVFHGLPLCIAPQVKSVAYRNLLKKIYRISDNTRIRLTQYQE